MLDIILLGRFEIVHNGQRLVIPTRNAQALLAYLALSAGQAHRRERLAGLLWTDSLEEAARGNLRHELWRLRKALEPAGKDYLISDDLTIAFNGQSDYQLDTKLFEATATESSTADDLMAALSLYSGELLPGFYQEWVYAERHVLHAAYEARMTRLLELLHAEGRWNEVIDWSTRWIAAGELPEPAYRSLMLAYANTGDRVKAVGAYERFSQELKKELNTTPSEQTQALYKQLQSGQWSPTPVLPSAVAQELPAAIATVPASRSTLPKPLTSFIGRESEIGRIAQLISGARLVTIAGAGGVGKTRLAIQAAGELSGDFPNGVFWVELAPISEASAGMHSVLSSESLVIQAIANALNVTEATHRPLQESIHNYLRERQLLLVLDNCEHLIAACAVVVERLLEETTHVKVLATSREPLGVPGEKVWFLPPLSLPEPPQVYDPERIAESEAVRLFIDRATDIVPNSQSIKDHLPTIAQICIRLDGIPLAIELAAARMNLLTAEEIFARLNSRFSLLTSGRRTVLPRHQTLRAAIDWSHELLSEPEQLLFRRLSIFAGSFTLAAAETVCSGEGVSTESILTLMGFLVDKSLLQVDQSRHAHETETRYRMLDTICTFSQLKLEEAGEARLLRNRHADYYVQLSESTEPQLYFQDQTPWFKLLSAEYDNLRAAIDWSVESDQPELALRLVATLTWFWFSYGSIREGATITLKVLALPSATAPTVYRARALNTAGYFHWMLDDTSTTRPLIEEALAILTTVEDKGHQAWARQLYGLVLGSEGDYLAADRAMREGVEATSAISDHRSNLTMALWGDIFTKQGDLIMAKKAYDDSIEVLRSLGNHNFMAYPVRRAGYLAMEEGKLAEAQQKFLESLAVNIQVGDRRGITACLISLAALALRLDQPLIAARLYGAVKRQMESLTILMPLDQLELERVRSQLRTTLKEEIRNEAIKQGRQFDENQAVALVMQTFGIIAQDNIHVS